MLDENFFLIIIAFIWLIGAIIQDFRKREVANWWNFSLIAVALAYRAFLSVYNWNYLYFVYGLLGFAVFFILANLFYYSRVFAGGDAKLLMGLGAVLPFSSSLLSNLMIFLYFVLLLLFLGGIYTLIYSFILVLNNRKKFKKEFSKQFKRNEKIIDILFFIAVFFAILVLIFEVDVLVVMPILLFLFPFLYIYAKSIEESCMIKFVSAGKLTEGDWLYENVKIGEKIIKPSWEGLSEKELKILKNSRKKVRIKEGVPFTPGFLFALVVLFLLIY